MHKTFMCWLFTKYYELTLPPSIRHMAYINPHLKVTEHGDATKSFTYRKRFIARSRPVSTLKHCYDDEIFVIGSGPSIQLQDVSKLAGKTVMLMNGSYHLANQIAFKCVIYTVIDRDFIYGHPELVFRALASEACCILTSDCVKVICELNPDALKRCPFMVIDDIQRPPNHHRRNLQQFEQWASRQSDIHYDLSKSTEECVIGFSENPQIGFFGGGTVMSAVVQIACYINPQRLYIMGFDIGNASQPRFYERAGNTKRSYLQGDYRQLIEPTFQLFAEKVLQREQLTAYNLSPVSILPRAIIPFLDYETLMREHTTPSTEA